MCHHSWGSAEQDSWNRDECPVCMYHGTSGVKLIDRDGFKMCTATNQFPYNCAGCGIAFHVPNSPANSRVNCPNTGQHI